MWPIMERVRKSLHELVPTKCWMGGFMWFDGLGWKLPPQQDFALKGRYF